MSKSVFTSYEEALDWLYHQLPFFQKQGGIAFHPGLDNIRALCEALGQPQNSFPAIHVGGTNGKGSVSHMLASVFQYSAYRTGLYTSPHLRDFRERIRVDGEAVSKDFVLEFVNRFQTLTLDFVPSFFELTLALALDYFAHKKVQMAIVEVGMGGRLDATRIVNPVLSIVTNVGMDHMYYLGDTKAKIAVEKAGIMQEGVPFILGESDEAYLEVFENAAKEKQCPFIQADLIEFKNYKLDLKGVYQQKNSRTVQAAINELRKKYTLPEEKVEKALQSVVQTTSLRARWEVLGENPLVITDTAHNEHGIKEILKQLESYADKELHFVWGMVDDKDHEGIIAMLPKNAQYHIAAPNIPRALAVERLYELMQQFQLQVQSYVSVREAFQQVLKKVGKNALIYVGGSTFVAAEIIGKKVGTSFLED